MINVLKINCTLTYDVYNRNVSQIFINRGIWNNLFFLHIDTVIIVRKSIVSSQNYADFIQLQILVREFGGVFYIDSSIRLRRSDMADIYTILLRNGGFVALTDTSTSVYQVTYSERYLYLPTNVTKLKEGNMFQAGVLLVYNTEAVYRNIVYWWVLCSLEQYCGAPYLGKRYCNCKRNRQIFCRCDRFDQSTLNVLVNNYYNFNKTLYLYDSKRKDNIVFIQRKITRKYNVTLCP